MARMRGLAQRYRKDGRLPPPVAALMREALVLRACSTIGLALARMRRLVRSGSLAPRADECLYEGRWVQTAGPLLCSTCELAHSNASAVVAAIQRAGIDVWVVGRPGEGLVLGVPLPERDRALAAIARDLTGPGWWARPRRGRRERLVRPAQLARRWMRAGAVEVELFRAHSYGHHLLGPEEAATLTFWEVGTSGLMELVGTRAHERFDARSARTVETIEGREYPGRSAFPVGRSLDAVDFPVDIVYTWVDGDDECWQASFRETAATVGRDLSESALDPARYSDRDELRYSLRSVWAFAGWVRRIYIVTAGQRPAWLREDERVRVVDHRELFPASALPTFNSHAIESVLHRIDGLAEHFIYFNDDVFVGRPLTPSHFFTPNGLARSFQSPARVPGYESDDLQSYDAAARRGQELMLERYGRMSGYKPLHSPHSVRRSVMDDIETEFAEAFERTEQSRFRAPADLSIPASFAQHVALATGRAVEGPIGNEYVNLESPRLSWHLDRLRLGRWFDTFCINETQWDAQRSPDAARAVGRFLEEYFPIASPWEALEPPDGPGT